MYRGVDVGHRTCWLGFFMDANTLILYPLILQWWNQGNFQETWPDDSGNPHPFSALQVGMATTPAIQKGVVTHVVTVVEFLRLTKHPIPGGWSSNRYSDTVDEFLSLIWIHCQLSLICQYEFCKSARFDAFFLRRIETIWQSRRAGIWEHPRAMRKASPRNAENDVKWQSHPLPEWLWSRQTYHTCTQKYQPFNDPLNKLLGSIRCFSYLGMVAADLTLNPGKPSLVNHGKSGVRSVMHLFYMQRFQMVSVCFSHYLWMSLAGYQSSSVMEHVWRSEPAWSNGPRWISANECKRNWKSPRLLQVGKNLSNGLNEPQPKAHSICMIWCIWGWILQFNGFSRWFPKSLRAI